MRDGQTDRHRWTDWQTNIPPTHPTPTKKKLRSAEGAITTLTRETNKLTDRQFMKKTIILLSSETVLCIRTYHFFHGSVLKPWRTAGHVQDCIETENGKSSCRTYCFSVEVRSWKQFPSNQRLFITFHWEIWPTHNAQQTAVIKCWYTLSCLDQYTAPNSKYTGGQCPAPLSNNWGRCPHP